MLQGFTQSVSENGGGGGKPVRLVGKFDLTTICERAVFENVASSTSHNLIGLSKACYSDNSVVLVRERTIPIERPPLVEVNTDCG
jgi:hypothetical protein